MDGMGRTLRFGPAGSQEAPFVIVNISTVGKSIIICFYHRICNIIRANIQRHIAANDRSYDQHDMARYLTHP